MCKIFSSLLEHVNGKINSSLKVIFVQYRYQQAHAALVLEKFRNIIGSDSELTGTLPRLLQIIFLA